MNKYYFHFLKERKSLSRWKKPLFSVLCWSLSAAASSRVVSKGLFLTHASTGPPHPLPFLHPGVDRRAPHLQPQCGVSFLPGQFAQDKSGCSSTTGLCTLEESGREFSALPGISQNQQSDDQRGWAMEPPGLRLHPAPTQRPFPKTLAS